MIVIIGHLLDNTSVHPSSQKRDTMQKLIAALFYSKTSRDRTTDKQCTKMTACISIECPGHKCKGSVTFRDVPIGKVDLDDRLFTPKAMSPGSRACDKCGMMVALLPSTINGSVSKRFNKYMKRNRLEFSTAKSA